MNNTKLRMVIRNAIFQQLRMMSWCTTVVVISDNSSFIASFSEISLKVHFLQPSTKIFVITHLPMKHLETVNYLHKLTSRMDAMIVTLAEARTVLRYFL